MAPACCRSLPSRGCLASELLPFARAMAARAQAPALQRLQPARWSRFWQGQVYEEQGAGSGPAGAAGWRQEQEREAAGGGGAAEAGQAQEDEIEEATDEDDW